MNSTPEQLRFASIPVHSVGTDFAGGGLSSDLGPVLLRGVDLQTGLTRRIAAALSDRCHQSYVNHSYHDILTQRIYQIGCGYEDGNDCVLTQLRQFCRDEIAIDTVEFVVGACLGIRELMGVFD